jgi:protein TonB
MSDEVPFFALQYSGSRTSDAAQETTTLEGPTDRKHGNDLEAEMLCQRLLTTKRKRPTVLRWVFLGIPVLAFAVFAYVADAVMNSDVAAPPPLASPIPAPDLEIGLSSSVLQPQDSPPLNVSRQQVEVKDVQGASPQVAFPEVRLKPRPIQQSKAMPGGPSPAPIPKQAVISKGEPGPPPVLAGPPASSGNIGKDTGNVLPALASPVVPALAPPPPERIRVGGELAAAKLVSQSKVTYPPMARQLRVQGTVQLEAIIGKDGTVQNLVVTGGPELLRQAAVEAVKRWHYRPTLLNGEPVEVITTVSVDFRLDR